MRREFAIIFLLAGLALICTTLMRAQEGPTFYSHRDNTTIKWESAGPKSLAILDYKGNLAVDGPPHDGLRRVEFGAGWWCSPKSTAGFICSGDEPTSLRIRGGLGSQSATPLLPWGEGSPHDLSIKTEGSGQIAITPAETTIIGGSEPLKVYTTFLGLPCGDAFPMPGCLPADRQGWLVQIEGGTSERFEVTFTWRDAAGSLHSKTETVTRAAPTQGKPSFTVVAFPVGRAKSAPWFPEGTEKVRTEVWPYTPKKPTVVEHESPQPQ